jgi:transcriptional regulator with XRE-family HTH domain
MEATMVGERLRSARLARRLSLQQVAEQADISAATLSRVENGKQALDVTLMLLLAKILECRPADLVDENGALDLKSELVSKFAALDTRARSAVWLELAEGSRKRRGRNGRIRNVAQEIEELLAQLDFLRAEIEAVRKRLR